MYVQGPLQILSIDKTQDQLRDGVDAMGMYSIGVVPNYLQDTMANMSGALIFEYSPATTLGFSECPKHHKAPQKVSQSHSVHVRATHMSRAPVKPHRPPSSPSERNALKEITYRKLSIS